MGNVFVLGLDEANRRLLEGLPGAQERYRFHALLGFEEVRGVARFPVERWLERCRRQLDDFDGDVDAIVSFWDFPVSEMAAVLCAERHLPSPSLESVLRCQHKLWSRLEQRRHVPSCTPAFAVVDPFDDRAVEEVGLAFPFWIKPVRSFRSYLGFRIASRDDLVAALAQIRAGVARIGEPLEWLLARVDPPPEVRSLGGSACIAEELVTGRQCTLEGYVHRGDVQVYGAVDSVRTANLSTFSRYQYPSRLPDDVQARMAEVAGRLMGNVGFDSGAFNIELFYDDDEDRIWLLEVNCRISQSHSELFAKVDGVSHHQVMVDLALGEEPSVRRAGGQHACAAKFFLRHWHDATVASVPDEDEVAEVERRVPGTTIHLTVRPGDRLAELADQDSYSYELGAVYVGAADDDELQAKFYACRAELGIELADVEGDR